MARDDYMPKDDFGKARLFVLFRDQIPPYLAGFGLTDTDPDIVQQAADATFFRAVVISTIHIQASAEAWTKWKDRARDGGTGEASPPPLAALPEDFPPPVPPGIVSRFRALAKRLKAHKNYAAPIGTLLGIEGREDTGPDEDTLQPRLRLRNNGGTVEVLWNWQGFRKHLDLLQIMVDRGDGRGFVLLTSATGSPTRDPEPLPAAPVKWTYKAIYRVNDALIGQWSPGASLTVGG
jgi:hypothetical protein